MTFSSDRPSGEAYHRFEIDRSAAGQRLDAFLARLELRAGLTRSLLQQYIRDGLVTVSGLPRKAGYRLQEAEVVEIRLPPPKSSVLIPEQVDYQVIHEDGDLVVISKPPGLVVHPACGNETGTLVHGLLFRCEDLAGIGGVQRPGIVHRLDKDTSGVMVIAKNDLAHQKLAGQFKDRRVEKIYRALVDGRLAGETGRIEAAIGRHPTQRKKMAVLPSGGREAVTNWRILERFESHSYVEIHLETGRTHQIRVHFAHAGHPVSGDPVYGRKRRELDALVMPRQCLHAYQLGFTHPATGARLIFQAPLWPDIEEILMVLRERSHQERPSL